MTTEKYQAGSAEQPLDIINPMTWKKKPAEKLIPKGGFWDITVARVILYH